MKLNRNEDCHCGSGKKYKKCHMEADEARERGRRSLSTLQQWVAFHGGGLVASVRERARGAAEVQAALQALHAGSEVSDPLSDPLAEQVALFDVVVGEQPIITEATTEELSLPQQQSLRQGLARSHLTLFQVLEVKRGSGVRLRDAFLERERWFADSDLASKLEPMEVVVGRSLSFDKRNVLLEGWEKVAFRGRKAAIADLAAGLSQEVVPSETAMLRPATAPVPVAAQGDQDLEDEGAEAEEVEVDDTRPAVGEASADVQAARVRWLKAHAVEVVRRARAAAPQPRT
jgi:hypothetical protein